MSYQKCPKCKGSGKKWNFKPTGCIWLDLAVTLPSPRMVGDKLVMDYPADEVCPVCKGAMIINEETGLPPIVNDKIEEL